MRLIKDELGLPEEPYSRRWTLWLGKVRQSMSIRVHHWLGNDDFRALHDHPTWFITIVLSGGYLDRSEDLDGTPRFDLLQRGSIRFRPAEYKHTVQLVQPNTWTLLLFGKPSRRWSFFLRESGKAIKRDKYFAEYGHHRQDGTAVRMRPDGTRI